MQQDEVMALMAEALKTCESVCRGMGDFMQYDYIKVRDALQAYESLQKPPVKFRKIYQ